MMTAFLAIVAVLAIIGLAVVALIAFAALLEAAFADETQPYYRRDMDI